MIQFDAAPPVPFDYPRLRALATEEIEQARIAGYLAENVDPRAPVQRPGLDNCHEADARDDMQDWRTRMYVIWFCYIHEQFRLIAAPAHAVEELVLEFQAQDVLDTDDLRIATAYAEAGGGLEPLSPTEREAHILFLKPHYATATALLEGWIGSQRHADIR